MGQAAAPTEATPGGTLVVANEAVRQAILEIAALSSAPGGGSSLRLFTSMDEAEDWLAQPLDTLL